MAAERVLVTGASGFIATHIVKLLLERGYIVRGTVRSLQNEQKVKPIRELVKNPEHPLELVVADCTIKEGWKEAVADCDYVLHTASPFPKENPKHNDDVIKPAVEGTMNVLEACRNEPKVKRVVITSSVVAVSGEFHDVKDDKLFTEHDWPNAGEGNAYTQSKTKAERAAWEFMTTEPRPSFTMCTVNPAMVLGPMLCGSPGTSIEIPRRLMNREMPMVPEINFPIVDVRDVAMGHLKAMTLPEAADHRHILYADSVWIVDMAKRLDKEFSSQGYNIPTKKAPYFAMWCMSWLDSSVNMILNSIGKLVKYDNTRMKCTLGIDPIGVDQTLLDMTYEMVERGQCKRTPQFKSRTTNK